MWFIEIENEPTNDTAPLPDWIECYVLVNIDPKCCGPLARELNALLPLRHIDPSTTSSDSLVVGTSDDTVSKPNTEHLKRIRRRPATDDEIKARELAESNDTDTIRRSSNEGDVVTTSNDADTTNSTGELPKERAKKNKQRKTKSNSNSKPWSLDMLVGSVEAVDEWLLQNPHSPGDRDGSNSSKTVGLVSVLAKYNLSIQSASFVRKFLPGRPAETKEELDEWNQSVWHTLFFEKKTSLFKEEEMALTEEETQLMIRGLNEAVKDAMHCRDQWTTWSQKSTNACDGNSLDESPFVTGVVVMNPLTGSIVARAADERSLQGMKNTNNRDGRDEDTPADEVWDSFPDEVNPLCTSTILAIQGVSRSERHTASGYGMESKEFKTGQVS